MQQPCLSVQLYIINTLSFQSGTVSQGENSDHLIPDFCLWICLCLSFLHSLPAHGQVRVPSHAGCSKDILYCCVGWAQTWHLAEDGLDAPLTSTSWVMEFMFVATTPKIPSAKNGTQSFMQAVHELITTPTPLFHRNLYLFFFCLFFYTSKDLKLI